MESQEFTKWEVVLWIKYLGSETEVKVVFLQEAKTMFWYFVTREIEKYNKKEPVIVERFDIIKKINKILHNSKRNYNWLVKIIMKNPKQIALKIAKKRYELEKLEIELTYYEEKPKEENKIDLILKNRLWIIQKLN